MNKALCSLIVALLISFYGLSVDYTWVGTTSTSWNTTTNWSPAGLPGAADNITINNAALANQPVMPSNKTVTNFTISAGTLNLGGFILTATGTSTCSGGTLNTGTFTPNTAGSVTFSGTTFNSQVNATAANIFFNGGIFNGAINSFTHTGTTISTSTGGCTFAGVTSNTIINSGTAEMRLGVTNPDIFNGPLNLNMTNAGKIQIGYSSSNNQFNENVVVSSTGTGTINIGFALPGASCVLAAGKTISANVFSSGTLTLSNFIQTGTTSQIINLTGSAIFISQSYCVINGSLSVTAPALYLHGGTFNGAINEFTKTGSTFSNGTGGCVFGGTTSNTFTNTGTGEWRLAQDNPDIYNGPAFFTITNSGIITVSLNSVNNQFNENVVVSSTGSGTIRFGYSNGTCVLALNKTITASTFSSGTLYFKNFTQNGSTIQNINLTGTASLSFNPGTIFNGSLTSVAPKIFFNGAVFNGATNQFTQTGAFFTPSDGGCTFAGATSNTITNTSTGEIRMGNVNPDIFNGPVTFNNSSSGTINIGYNSLNNQFNQNITLTSTGAGSIQMSQGTGTSILAIGKTISTPTFTAGVLRLRNFTQNGSTSQNITTTGTSILLFETGTTINGSLTTSAPNLRFNGSTFNGAINEFTQTGTVLNLSIGGCTFAGATSNTIINSGTGEIRMGHINADVFNGIANFNTSNSGTINVGYNALNNQFNQNITLTSSGIGSINFGQGTGTNVIAAGKTISTSTFSAGNLRLRNFTQIGATAQTLTLTGSSNVYFETGTSFNGSLTTLSPNLFLNGSTFNGAINQFTQTGSNNNVSIGGCAFNGVISNTITNSGTGEIRMGNVNPDTFNDFAVFNNTSSGTINIGYNSIGNQFNDDITVSSTGTGTIAFSQGTGSSTLATNKTINNGTFSSGILRLKNFTQVGNSVTHTLYLSGTSTIYFESGTTFNGYIDCAAPNIYLNGSSFNYSANFSKFDGTNNLSLGGNNFTNCLFSNSSGADFTLGGTNPDSFFSQAEFTSNGTGYLDIAYSSAGNSFNSCNIVLYSFSTSGIYFGFSGGTTSMDNSDLIAPNFAIGPLVLTNVNYNSGFSANQNISVTGSSSFQTFNSIFDVELTITAPSLQLSNSIFNQEANFIKTGSSIDFSDGGNIFNGVASFENQSLIGELYEGTTFNDFYYDDVHYSGVGEIHPAYSGTTYYYKDVYTTPLTLFGTGGGTVSLNGTVDQTFYSDYISPTSISYLDIQSSSTCFFSGKTQITTKVQFISGYVDATETEPLTLTETATISTSASDASHSIGYIQKIGNTPFDFPTGNGSYLLPISISAPNDVTDAFTAKYIDYSSHPVYSHYLKEPTLGVISDCHYWNLNRDAGSSEVYVTISWNNAYHMCQVTDPGDLVVAHWNAGTSIWEDYGNGGTTGSVSDGTITTAFALTNYSPITLASTTGINPLPIELLSFTAEGNLDQVDLKWITSTEHNNDYFTVERSNDGVHFELMGSVKSKAVNGNSSQKLEYSLIDDDPYNGIVYYRLKQTDFDGVFEYSNIVSVTKNEDLRDLRIYPNPNNGIFQLEFSSDHSGVAIVEINSSRGEKIGMKKLELNAGTQTKELNFSELPKGVYFLNVTVNDQKITRKLVIH